MDRRLLLRAALLGGAALLLQGHTPYRQWVAYRKRRLLIGSSKTDPASYRLSKQVAETLITNLPASRARASRAPNPWRLASLLATDQLDVGIFSADDATALAQGSAPLEDFGGLDLRVLFGFEGHLLVSRPDFPPRHAYLVSETLDRHGGALPGARLAGSPDGAIPLHPGSRAYGEGRPPPPGPE